MLFDTSFCIISAGMNPILFTVLVGRLAGFQSTTWRWCVKWVIAEALKTYALTLAMKVTN